MNRRKIGTICYAILRLVRRREKEGGGRRNLIAMNVRERWIEQRARTSKEKGSTRMKIRARGACEEGGVGVMH